MAKLDKQIINLIGQRSDLDIQRLILALEIKQLPYKFIEVGDSIPQELNQQIKDQCLGLELFFLPAMVERNTGLENCDIISRYIDQRYPEPNLFPQQPTARGRTDFSIWRITQQYYTYLNASVDAVNEMMKPESERDKKIIADGSLCRMQLIEDITRLESIYKENSYFLSDSITFMDCAMIPLLLNLPKAKINLSQLNVPNIRKFLNNESGKKYFKNAYPAKAKIAL